MSHLVPFSTILFEGRWLVCTSSKLQLTWRGSGFGVSTSTTRHFARGVATSCRKPLNTIHNWKVLDQEGSKEKAPRLVTGEWDKRCNNAQHLESILVHKVLFTACYSKDQTNLSIHHHWCCQLECANHLKDFADLEDLQAAVSYWSCQPFFPFVAGRSKGSPWPFQSSSFAQVCWFWS